MCKPGADPRGVGGAMGSIAPPLGDFFHFFIFVKKV